ncbi:uncharacterized protein LOC130936233 [Arachis stenosperma]|uniref:uncharacterized protein LOC130936233 n=1 Tax=Arachis stenosperma TaxID=217475 RepID=UPI0025AC6E22|nr:uncharacterized protein LOC130936233 [Arachis stenosperma]XP_057722254.1 uncharacterized protein LOC130936233 [Arachis stenosperma]XP_057722255.1 uncharacterized protein LOC130936233 [Arachis stenosperma]
MACSDIFVLVHPNGYIKDTVGGATFESWDPFLMNVDTDHQDSLLELKNLILANMGELGRKKISHMAYKLHGIIGPQLSDSRVIWLTSDEDIHLMFDFHVSNRELRCIELYIKVEDVISSASLKANPQVVQSDKIGRGPKRVQSPVTSPSFVFPNRVENVKVDGKRTNVCASPANMASRGVAVDKLSLPPKTGNIGGACSVFPPPTSKKSAFVDMGADLGLDLGLSPPPKMQKMVYGKGKPVENGVLIPDIEESNVYSKSFQNQNMCRNLEPPITSKSQMVLEGRVKELEIRLESKENERAALEELKVTLTAKISNLENKLKEADKEKRAQLRKEKTASKGIIEPLEAEVKHLRCSVLEAEERAHRNIMEQVCLLAPGIDFSRVHPDNRVVNGEIVNPKKDSAPQVTYVMEFGCKRPTHPMLRP